MASTHSFKFLDGRLNRDLIDLLIEAAIDHSIGEDGTIAYASADRDVVENDLICSIRDQVFPSWQIVTCPGDWAERYREYMTRREIPFAEESSDDETWFLIPRRYRPHSWKLEAPVRKTRLAESR